MNPKGQERAQAVSTTEKGKGRAQDVQEPQGVMDVDATEAAPPAKHPKRKKNPAAAEEPTRKKKKGSAAAAPAAPTRLKRQIRLELKAINGMHWEPRCERCERNDFPCRVKFQRSDRTKLVCYDCASRKATCKLASTAKKTMDSLGELGSDCLDSDGTYTYLNSLYSNN